MNSELKKTLIAIANYPANGNSDPKVMAEALHTIRGWAQEALDADRKETDDE